MASRRVSPGLFDFGVFGSEGDFGRKCATRVKDAKFEGRKMWDEIRGNFLNQYSCCSIAEAVILKRSNRLARKYRGLQKHEQNRQAKWFRRFTLNPRSPCEVNLFRDQSGTISTLQ